MDKLYNSSYRTSERYIPKSLSEINDFLGSMILWAPTFVRNHEPDHNINTEFQVLLKSFGVVRKKLGEERYTRLVDLAAQAKALFAEDPDEDNGKTSKGRKILYQIEDVLGEVSRARKAAKLPDDEGKITGD